MQSIPSTDLCSIFLLAGAITEPNGDSKQHYGNKPHQFPHAVVIEDELNDHCDNHAEYLGDAGHHGNHAARRIHFLSLTVLVGDPQR